MKTIFGTLVGLLISGGVWANHLDPIFSGCNIASLEQINKVKPDGDYTFGWPLGDQASHVFLARLS